MEICFSKSSNHFFHVKKECFFVFIFFFLGLERLLILGMHKWVSQMLILVFFVIVSICYSELKL